MTERRIADSDVATIGKLLKPSLETVVAVQPCRVTIDLIDSGDDVFYHGVTVGVVPRPHSQRWLTPMSLLIHVETITVQN